MELNLDSSIFGDYEEVNRMEMEGFSKRRLVAEDATIDISVAETDDPESYIEGRKEDINDNTTEVPHPYKAEKEERETGGLVEFNDGYGLGYADAEYNTVEKEDELARYRYFMSWKKFPEKGKVVEIEVYVPKDEFDASKIENLRESVSV